MNSPSILLELKKSFPAKNILVDEPVNNHTTFQIGGPAYFVVIPENQKQISHLIACLPNTDFFVIGNGSNLLVSDKGIRGVVIKINNNMNKITQNNNTLICQSGALLSRIASFALKCGLGGFEFAAGIPGTLGGAVVMNAGAYGREIKDVVVQTQYIDFCGNIRQVTQHDFGYRTSIFSDIKAIITECTLSLHKKNKDEIKAEMLKLA